MKSYLINLDRSTERLEFFTRQAELLGIPFERISAVEGRRLSSEDLASAVAATFEFQPINVPVFPELETTGLLHHLVSGVAFEARQEFRHRSDI